MILAYQNGTLIAVTKLGISGINTNVQEIHGGAKFKIRKGETDRKLFDGKSAVDDAIAWVNEQLERRKIERRKEKYPLDIMEINHDEFSLISKGHHDAHLFIEAVKAKGINHIVRKPVQCWIKTMPEPRGEKRSCHYHIVTENMRGAWPATYLPE